MTSWPRRARIETALTRCRTSGPGRAPADRHRRDLGHHPHSGEPGRRPRPGIQRAAGLRPGRALRRQTPPCRHGRAHPGPRLPGRRVAAAGPAARGAGGGGRLTHRRAGRPRHRRARLQHRHRDTRDRSHGPGLRHRPLRLGPRGAGRQRRRGRYGERDRDGQGAGRGRHPVAQRRRVPHHRRRRGRAPGFGGVRQRPPARTGAERGAQQRGARGQGAGADVPEHGVELRPDLHVRIGGAHARGRLRVRRAR